MGWVYNKETGEQEFKNEENLGWLYSIAAILFVAFLVNFIDEMRMDDLKDANTKLEDKCIDYEIEIDDLHEINGILKEKCLEYESKIDDLQLKTEELEFEIMDMEDEISKLKEENFELLMQQD